MPARHDENGKCLRGSSNSNDRGSAAARRARKTWLLNWFGDGIHVPCYSCGTRLAWDTL